MKWSWACALALLSGVEPAFGQVVELAELSATDGLPGGDDFGVAVSLSGDRALVGANSSDALGYGSGSAWVFERQPSGAWIETAQLLPGDGDNFDSFGSSTSLDGERALVGSVNAVFGPGSSASGAAYVFERQASGSWIQTAKLTALDAFLGSDFGRSVSLNGERALVGAPAAGDVLPACYVFERQPSGAWTQVAKLVALDAMPQDHLGSAVSLSGDRALCGAHFGDGAVANSGAAYVFERQPDGSWVQAAKLAAADGLLGDLFGSAVSLEGDTALVGAEMDDDLALDAGAAFVFERDSAGTWRETGKITASEGSYFDRFGSAVALSGDRAAIGAKLDDELGMYSGSVYVFDRQSDGTWAETSKLTASDGVLLDTLGISVAMSDGRILAGAPNHDGIVPFVGAAFLFDGEPLSGDVSQIALGTGGAQTLSVDAGHLHAGDLRWVLGSTSGSSPGLALPGGAILPLNLDGYFWFTLANPNTPPLSGSLGLLDGSGSAIAEFRVPAGADPSLAGITVHHAFAVIEIATLAVDFASNAVSVSLVP